MYRVLQPITSIIEKESGQGGGKEEIKELANIDSNLRGEVDVGDGASELLWKMSLVQKHKEISLDN